MYVFNINKMKRSSSNFSLGPGLTVQLGPFKTNKNDFPKVQKRPWQGGGVAGGGQGHAGHGNWYTSMNPVVFPMQFPMPPTVLKHTIYPSVVTTQDIYKPGKRSAPPGMFEKPVQPVGQPTLPISVQKPGMTVSGHSSRLQEEDQKGDEMLMEEEPVHMLEPQQGVPQTAETSQPHVEAPPLPPEVGSTSVVLHPEEINETHFSAHGPPLFMDSLESPGMQLNHSIAQGDQQTSHPSMISELDAELRRRALAFIRDREAEMDVQMTRTQFGDGTSTMSVDQGGSELVPFKQDVGSGMTQGISERNGLRHRREQQRRRKEIKQRHAPKPPQVIFVPHPEKQGVEVATNTTVKAETNDAATSMSLEEQAAHTAAMEQHMRGRSDHLVPTLNAPQPQALPRIVRPRIRTVPARKRTTEGDDGVSDKRPRTGGNPEILDPLEVKIMKGLAKGSRHRNRTQKLGIRVGEGPSATMTLKQGNIVNLA